MQGDREEKGHGRDRAQARQHPDEGSDDAPDETIQDIIQRENDGESVE